MSSVQQSVIKTQGRFAESGSRTWERIARLQGDGLFPRSFYRYQSAVETGELFFINRDQLLALRILHPRSPSPANSIA